MLAAMALGALGSASPAGAARAVHKKPKPVRTVTATLKAQVAAAPYASGGTVVIPLLVSKVTPARGRLRSPAGVLLLRSTSRLGKVAPLSLRPGDALTVRARLSKAIRGAVYWRLRPLRATLGARSATLSPGELQAIVTSLGGWLGQLTGYTVSSVGTLQADVADLRSQLTGLRGELASLRSRVDGLDATVESVRSNLQGQIDALGTQVADLASALNGLQTQVDGLDA